MFSREELFIGMQQLELPEQITVLEKLVAEHGIDEQSADLISMFMMSVLMDLDGGAYPPDLVKRAEGITEAVRKFNGRRFGA